MFGRILIAYDESKEAKRALDTGMRLAAELHAQMTLVTVLEPLPSYVNIACAVAPALPEELRQERRAEIQRMQAAVKQRAAELGVNAETLLVEGDEISAILEATRKTHADLLVIGLHRHVPGIEWSGTMRCIANETPCPILAVC